MMPCHRVICAVAVTLLLLCSCAHGLRIRPTATSLIFEVRDEEVCMYSKSQDFYEGVSMHYHVLDGGEDFDVFVRNPMNRTIYSSFAGEHGLEDRVYFTTRSQMEYSYCIDNRRYSQVTKRIKMEIGMTSLKRWKSRMDPLRKAMQVSDSHFLGSTDDQMIMRLRERILRTHVERVFEIMEIRGVAETVVLVLVSVLNVFFVTRLFKKRHTYPAPSARRE